MAEGRIIKGIGGFYYVRTEDGAIQDVYKRQTQERVRFP